jgi:predicted metalloprotease with PDZ domain
MLPIKSIIISMLAFAQPFESQMPDAPQRHSINDAGDPRIMTLNVDATDITRRIFRVQQTISVAKSGPMTLLFPKWLPGTHAPSGDVSNLAGLTFKANGQTLSWRRDPIDMHAFHLDVPAGAKQLEIAFQFLSSLGEKYGRVIVTREMMNVQWGMLSLYPAGYRVDRIPVQKSITYPTGWRAGTALRPVATSGDTVTYGTVTYETLIDSPVFVGKYFRSEMLGANVTLNIVADARKNLEVTQAQLTLEKNMVSQLSKLFGARYYDRYDFLLAVSDKLSDIGLEHHRSSENAQFPDFFATWEYAFYGRYLLAHEMIHSWNGKHRRPADMVTNNYNKSTSGSLLWAYEGQTQFWTLVAAARSGLVSKNEVLETYAHLARTLDAEPGRQWRPISDATMERSGSEKAWVNWQRGTQTFYNEPIFLWLEIDAMIRAKTNGKKSMDDFARAFYGGKDGDLSDSPYTFDDVVTTLNKIAPYDWATHIRTRLTETDTTAPFGGLKASGYDLVYTDQPNQIGTAQAMGESKVDLNHSLGFTVGNDGVVSSVLWDSIAYKAALVPGNKIVSVDGQVFSADALKAAIVNAKGATNPIRLKVKTDEQESEIKLSWHGGLRYPHLIKIGKGVNGLDELLEPLK